MKKVFTSLLALLVSASSFAVEEITSGDSYYIQNKESGLFLCGANSWGTHASVAAEGDVFTLTGADGAYSILDQTLTTANKGLGNLFVDNNDGSVKFTIAAVEGEAGVFTIASGEMYLAKASVAASVTGYEVTEVAELTEAAKWYILTKEEAIQKLASATEENPLSATFLLTNPNFSRGHSTAAWTMEASNKNLGGGDESNFCAESNQSTFTLSQTLTGVPNGVYALSAQGFYRQDGTDSVNLPVFYLNGATVTFPAKTGTENSMKDASNSFNGGTNYLATTEKVNVIDGTITVGAKNEKNVNLWCIWDNFQLTYYGGITDFSVYADALAKLVAEGESLSGGTMNGTVQTTLESTFIKYKNKKASDYSTEEEWVAAVTRMKTAIDNAKASMAVYNEASKYFNAANNLDRMGLIDYKGSDIYAEIFMAYDDRTLDSLTVADKAAFADALRAAAKAQNTVGADMTLAMVNPDFETGDITGWTTTESNDTGARSTSNNTYKMANSNGAYLFNTWSVGNAISQTVTGLNPGKYTVKAIMATDAGKTLTLTANGTEVTAASVDKGTGVEITDSNVVVANGSLSISAGTADKCWYKADNFRLTFVSPLSLEDLYPMVDELLEAGDSIEGTMNAEAAAALATALEKGKALDKSVENNVADVCVIVGDLQGAVADAQASVAAYAAAKTELDKRTATVESLNTNFYTKEAYDTYYTTPLEKYNALTLTTAEANALVESTGWHAAVQLNSFLGSAFGVKSYDDVPYINTWSVEGGSDGSNFTAPFYEYWTGDGNSLGERTLTATMTDLAPGEYTVSAWTRVRVKNGDTNAPYGISLVANDADSIDVCAGEQVGTSQMYLGTYTTNVTVGEDSTLTIQYVVAADNNISWLSFKDVKFGLVPAKTDTLTYSFESTVGEGYEGFSSSVDMEKILKELGATSVDDLNIYAVLGDGTRDSNYKLGTTPEANIDGWRDTAGNWQLWGAASSQFCVKADFSAESAQLSYVAGKGTTEVTTYQAVFALANKTEGAGEYDSVYVVVKLNYAAAPEINAEIIDTIDVAVTEKPGTSYSGLTATFDMDKVIETLGVADLTFDNVSVYIVKADGSLVKNTTDGWLDADGNPSAWGNENTKYCIKLNDPSTGTFEWLGAHVDTYAEGDTFVGRWAIVSDETNKGVVLKVTVTFTEATAIDAIEAGKAGAEGIYNIAGQKLSGLQKGLNIVDGKKVYVK